MGIEETYRPRNKTTSLMPDPPKGLNITAEDQRKYDLYTERQERLFPGTPRLNINDFLLRFNRKMA